MDRLYRLRTHLHVLLILFLLMCVPGSAQEISDQQRAFFESRIRPVLVERCYRCHNSSDVAEGDLALDSREGVRTGGFSGPAVEPGDVDRSLLLAAIRHETDDLRMPQDDGKLSDAVIADFERWVAEGAPDPRDTPPTATELESAISWQAIRERRQQLWSYQPLSEADAPDVSDNTWSDQPIDRFLLDAMRGKGLEPADDADRATLIRRLSFALTGLPPTPDEIADFLGDTSADSFDRLIDRLIESPQFGERWGRHWLDWMRFAESHGSEGDPSLPFAYRYRDYVIRALNQDVPYDRLVQEHLAGDLLPSPRLDPTGQFNESIYGLGHLRMMEHGYAPIDALEEKTRFTENQIDVVSKAFLGLTVACARCHDHKFDAISQQDYYALYGIFGSSRLGLVVPDTKERQATHVDALQALKPQIRERLASAWLNAVDDLVAELPRPDAELDERWTRAVEMAGADGARSPLHDWLATRESTGDGFAASWEVWQNEWNERRAQEEAFDAASHSVDWNLADHSDVPLYQDGLQGETLRQPSGEFTLHSDGEEVVANLHLAGVYSNALTNKHRLVLSTGEFPVDFDKLWLKTAGDGDSRSRFVLHNYPRVIGLVYKGANPNSVLPQWSNWDVTYFDGDRMYVEIATGRDLPVEVRGNDRSWFGITRIVGTSNDGPQPIDTGAPLASLLSLSPESIEALRDAYRQQLRNSIEAWALGEIDDRRTEFLAFFVRAGLLPNRLSAMPDVAELVTQYRQLESEVPVPVRTPGVLESRGEDSPLFVRGNHLVPGDPVPRRFLEAFSETAYTTDASGRLELALEWTSPSNPLFARVMVNRVWHHLFGRGIVASPDNFGHLGLRPTHPEMLDYLAAEFIADGYSIKRLIRRIVSSRAYQLSSVPSATARDVDPDNQYLSHQRLRRLEAEAIRDSMLSVSGALDRSLFGPSTNGDSTRRSVYVAIRRNSLDPFLTVFDMPRPFSTTGRRDITNVPAQSLAMLNNASVLTSSRRLADRLVADESLDDRGRVEQLFLNCFGRPPALGETQLAFELIEGAIRSRDTRQQRLELAQVELDQTRDQISRLVDPVRERLLAEREADQDEPHVALEPYARWEFDEDLQDAVGELHGEPIDNARVEGGRLLLDGGSFVRTAPIPSDIREKTLEVWVQLNTLDQGGGGAITLQNNDGGVFDSIVYAERESRQWMAGSNGFSRTQSFSGPQEDIATEQTIHFAIVYDADGTIRGYRNGEPYGQPYKSSGPQGYSAGDAVVLFGMRHGTRDRRTHQLQAAIDRAQLYDRALSAEEVMASAKGAAFVSRRELLAALSQDHRERLASLEADAERLQVSIAELMPDEDALHANAPWRSLSHALFNAKEFIYIK